MSFIEAVKSVFSKYAVFQGRARTSEFWWFFLFNFLVKMVIPIIGTMVLGENPALCLLILYGLILYGLAAFLPSLAVGVRRLHDTGKSGWFILIGLIPVVGTIMLIIFYCQDSEPGENKYGPNPKEL